jgi:glutamine amidotransferase
MSDYVAIVDSGGANLASVKLALERLDVTYKFTDKAREIENASHVILPGVGAAKVAMARLREYNLTDVLPKLQQPVMGICLGMQLLFSHSQEGNVPLLKIIDAPVDRLRTTLPVPQIGWNNLDVRQDTEITKDLHGRDVYFVHSYAAPIGDYTAASVRYGDLEFSAIVHQDNFWGCQFHPERSAATGADILRRFLQL